MGESPVSRSSQMDLTIKFYINMPKLLGGTSPLKMLLWVDIWLV